MSDSTKMQKLFTCLFGSALYGTRTPTSDRDVKHVCLVPLNDLLLGKKVSNVVKKTNTAKNTRNSVDDVDEEFIPIQVFARDFMMGQTYALEFAFAIDGNHAEQTFYNAFTQKPETPDGLMFVQFVKELREKFLTSNIKAMMGYVVNQASLYSFKGERLNASREFLEILDVSDHPSIGEVSLGHVYDNSAPFREAVEALQVKYPKYFKKTEYDIGGGRMKQCFTLLEKTFPFTNTFNHSKSVCDTLIKKYGSRADQASASNVDWKATMHALRIVDEGLDLLEHHELTFPFDVGYVAKLLQIKRGEIPLEHVTKELTDKLDKLKILEQTTTLPAYDQNMQKEFDAWLAGWMRRFYNL